MDLAIYVFLFVESPQLLASTLKEQVLFLKIEKSSQHGNHLSSQNSLLESEKSC